MSFSSPAFLFLFLPVVLSGYVLLRGLAARNLFLLAASLLFYAWGEGAHALLLMVSIALNHQLGGWVARARVGDEGGAGWWTPRRVIALTVAVNVALLGVFKYSPFLVTNFNVLLGAAGMAPLSVPRVHLPIGLSFFTFQAMSYVFDVHMQKADVQRNPLNMALYVALFPQLILGPIVRYRHIAEQLTARVVGAEDFARGASRFTLGLGKKVLIADTLAIAADGIFAIPPGELTPGLAWLGVLCFTLQLYHDFSAYSDMAIGLGRMLGFHFRENFRYPLLARTRTEYFRRWHISFFTWMRDYVYIPLCGKDCPRWRANVNVMLVWLLAGLWHGASWTFIIWGAANGLLIIVERLWVQPAFRYVWWPLQHVYSIALTMAGMVLFRAGSMAQAGAFYAGMAGIAGGDGVAWHAGMFLHGELALVLTLGLLGAGPVFPWLVGRLRALLGGGEQAETAPFLGLAGCWVALVLAASAMTIAARTYTPFVYFQF